MTNDLQQARIEAAARVYDEAAIESPQDYPLQYEEAMQYARDMLAAADAVELSGNPGQLPEPTGNCCELPTVEQIAEVLKPLIADHHETNSNDKWWVSDHAHDYAEAILALLEGEAGE